MRHKLDAMRPMIRAALNRATIEAFEWRPWSSWCGWDGATFKPEEWQHPDGRPFVPGEHTSGTVDLVRSPIGDAAHKAATEGLTITATATAEATARLRAMFERDGIHFGMRETPYGKLLQAAADHANGSE